MALMEPLSKEQEDAILADVGYTREQLEADLIQLREWLNQQEHLPPSRLKEKDCFLKTYLIGSKGSLETAKRKLDAYYTYRAHCDILSDRDPLLPEYMEITKSCSSCILPRLSKGQELILINSMDEFNAKHYNYLYNMRKILQLVELKLRMPEVLATSLYIVGDSKNLTPRHLAGCTPTTVKEMFNIIQNVLPFRIKGIFIVNSPSLVEMTLNNLIKPFLSEKLQKRFQVFSGGYEVLDKFIDSKILPVDFGGEESATLKQLAERWSNEEISKRGWFINELSEQTDESKRIYVNNSIDKQAYFGVYGSLKKLVLD